MLAPLTISLLVLCITCLILMIWKKNSKLPPGPLGIPFFGYYPFLSAQHYIDSDKLRGRYGDVMSFRTVGGKLIVVLNGVNAIKDVLLGRSEEFIARPEEHNLLSWLSDGLGITQEEGFTWKKHRYFFIQALRNLGLGSQETELSLQKEIQTLLKDVRKEKGKPLDFYLHIAYVVNSVINPILFSERYEKYSEEFKDVAEGARDLVEMFAEKKFLTVGYIYKYIVMSILPSTKRIRKAKQSFKDITKKIVDQHVETFDPDNIRDYIDCYLYEAHKLEKSGTRDHIFTRDRLHGIALNMLMEGTDTVAGTICGMLVEISKHLKEQKLVQGELDSVVGLERLPSWIDGLKMPYYKAFLQELYRVAMPFNTSLYYSNFEETTIQGYQIPKRSMILANLWTINNDPVLYPEPSKFDPSRFLGQERKKINKDGPCLFGVGKRTCIVESLADKEIFLIIASILQNFTLLPASNNGLIKAVPRNDTL